MTRNMKSNLGIVAAILVVIGIFFYTGSSPTDVIDLQLNAIQKRDYQKAFSYMSKDFHEATALKDYEKFIDNTVPLKNNKSIHIKEKTIKDKSGTISAVLIDKEGNKTPVEYKIIKEEDGWKIQVINLNP